MSSSTSGHSQGWRGSGRRGKATPDYDYEGPARFCFCGDKALRWVSGSEANPGRRFYSYLKIKGKKCRYFEWHNGPFTQRSYEYIRELKYELNMKEFDAEGDCCRDYSDEELNEEVCSLVTKDVKAKRLIAAV